MSFLLDLLLSRPSDWKLMKGPQLAAAIFITGLFSLLLGVAGAYAFLQGPNLWTRSAGLFMLAVSVWGVVSMCVGLFKWVRA